MDNQEAVNFVSKINNPQIAAKQLIVEALKRERKNDISCIVVQFKWLLSYLSKGYKHFYQLQIPMMIWIAV